MADDVEAALPRGGSGERDRMSAWCLVLLLVSPLAPIVAAVSHRLVMGQVQRGWRDITVVGAAVSVAVLVVWSLTWSGVPSLLGWLVWTGVLAVPLGVAVGAGAVGLLERWAGAQSGIRPSDVKRAVEVARRDRVVVRVPEA